MKVYITPHAQKRIAQRGGVELFISVLHRIMFRSEGVEVIERETQSQRLDSHKIKLGRHIIVFSDNCKNVITFNPRPPHSLKNRRRQVWREKVNLLLKGDNNEKV